VGYFPLEQIVTSLTGAGLWHGRASILVNAEVQKAFEEDVYKRWTHTFLAAFGGLYVTGDINTAKFYAESAANTINDYYESRLDSLVIAQPEVHRIFLLPGVELALDEDELGWAYIPNGENNWEALGLVYDHSINLAVDAGVYDAMEGSFSTLFKELEREEKQNPDFLWNPLDAQPMVDQLSQLYAGPILEAWYRRWQNFSPPPCRPNLRLLNQLWYADPPIIDRLT